MTGLVLQWAQPPAPVAMQWAGPNGATGTPAGGPVAVVIGPPGVQGPPGGAISIPGLAEAAITIGQALVLNRATGGLKIADSTHKPTAFVVGLALAPQAIGFVATAVIGPFTLLDWTLIAGTVALTPGGVYFLGANGMLTLTAPSSPSVLTVVGIAENATTLIVNPQLPIQL